jgi:DNA repair exonuclease SbcCD ATPase subunit
MKEGKERLSGFDSDIKTIRAKIELQDTFVKKKEVEKTDSLNKIQNEITEYNLQIDKETEVLNDLQTQIFNINQEIESYSDILEKVTDIKTLQKQINSKVKKTVDEQQRYEEMIECPTCKQEVGPNHKTFIIDHLGTELNKFNDGLDKLDIKLKKLNDQVEEYNNLNNRVSDLNTEVYKINQTIHGYNLLIQKYSKNLKESGQDNTSINEEKVKLKSLAKQIVDLDKQRRKLSEEIHYQSLCSGMLQDTGIKAKIIKQYIPVINKMVGKYMSILDFYVSFNLDENFNEVIKSRHRDEFTYDSFSQGEKQRIDLSLLFTWRDVAKMKASVHTNLLILDETLDASLDDVGAGLCMTLLNSLTNTNVFVISHRESLEDKFQSTIRLTKKNNFTVLV